VSELVTNAVAHARRTSVLTLAVAVAVGMIEVGVTEVGSSRHTIPPQRDVVIPGVPEVLREGGRGLMIVEALSHDWGVSANGSGKHVWFRRPVAAQWPYTAACACSTDPAGGLSAGETGRLLAGTSGGGRHRVVPVDDVNDGTPTEVGWNTLRDDDTDCVY
jgi:hypothetical protein